MINNIIMKKGFDIIEKNSTIDHNINTNRKKRENKCSIHIFDFKSPKVIGQFLCGRVGESEGSDVDGK